MRKLHRASIETSTAQHCGRRVCVHMAPRVLVQQLSVFPHQPHPHPHPPYSAHATEQRYSTMARGGTQLLLTCSSFIPCVLPRLTS